MVGGRWRHIPLEASQRNRDHPPATVDTSRWDTDKVVALITAVAHRRVDHLSGGAWFGCMEEGVPCARGV